MADWTETNRGVVFPWQCDHYGHLNVRYYTHFFDDAGFQIWSLIGLKLDDIHDRGVHPVVAQITVTFLHELKAGSLIIVKGGFTKAGTKSIGHTQRMYNVDTGVLCRDPRIRSKCSSTPRPAHRRRCPTISASGLQRI